MKIVVSSEATSAMIS